MTSFCSGCGASLPESARFCSACGKAATSFAPGAAQTSVFPILRPRNGRKIAGVCRGLADHYGWDVTLTRVIAVLLAVGMFPVGLVAYVLFWVLLPEESLGASPVNNLSTTVSP